MQKVLIDIGHPAYFHWFKNLAKNLENDGISVLFTFREKGVTKELIEHENFKFLYLGKVYINPFLKLWGLVKYTIRLLFIMKNYKPDIVISAASFYAAQAAFLLGIPKITLEDLENWEQIILYKPFSDIIITNNSFKLNLGRKHVKINTFFQMSFLLPKYFKPDISVLDRIGIAKGEKFVFVRFVKWSATHDFGQSGIDLKMKMKLIESIANKAKVFITSEVSLPPELEVYRFDIQPWEMHHILSFSSLYIGESATMASEAAMLGVPSIYIDNKGRGYTDELESEYGLVYNFSESDEDFEKALEKAIQILEDKNSKAEFKLRQQKMLSEKIDVTAFLFWLITNYPQSVKQLKTDPKVFDQFFSS